MFLCCNIIKQLSVFPLKPARCMKFVYSLHVPGYKSLSIIIAFWIYQEIVYHLM